MIPKYRAPDPRTIDGRPPLRVAVRMVVLIDRADYAANYGSIPDDDLRDDVRRAVLNSVTSGGVLADGIVDADLRD